MVKGSVVIPFYFWKEGVVKDSLWEIPFLLVLEFLKFWWYLVSGNWCGCSTAISLVVGGCVRLCLCISWFLGRGRNLGDLCGQSVGRRQLCEW